MLGRVTAACACAGAGVVLACLGLFTGCSAPPTDSGAVGTSAAAVGTPAASDAATAPIGPTAATDGQLTPKGQLLGPFPVARVVDGDTIRVRTDAGEVKVRLIGIDTPETVAPDRPVGCFGPQASLEAERLLSGASVYLELDPSQGDTDRYGRTLAYVWTDPHTNVNLQLVQGGFATEYTYDQPYAYQAEFRAAQANAKTAQLGLWSPSTCDGRY